MKENLLKEKRAKKIGILVNFFSLGVPLIMNPLCARALLISLLWAASSLTFPKRN